MNQNHEKYVFLDLILHTLYLILYTDIDEGDGTKIEMESSLAKTCERH